MDEIAAQKAQLDAAKASCQKEIERLEKQFVGMSSILTFNAHLCLAA